MTNELQKFIKEATSVRLANEDKAFMRAKILMAMRETPYQKRSVLSPFASFSFVHLARYVALALVVVIGAGGGLTYASVDALPNQTLYPVKIATEEIRSTLTVGSQAKANYEIARTERRIEEVATLALVNQLDEKTRAISNAYIEQHTAKVQETSERIKETHPEVTLELNARLATSINQSTKVLTTIKEKSSINGELDGIVEDTQKIAKLASAQKQEIETVLVEITNEDQKEATKDKLKKIERDFILLKASYSDSVEEEKIVTETVRVAQKTPMTSERVSIQDVQTADMPVVSLVESVTEGVVADLDLEPIDQDTDPGHVLETESVHEIEQSEDHEQKEFLVLASPAPVETLSKKTPVIDSSPKPKVAEIMVDEVVKTTTSQQQIIEDLIAKAEVKIAEGKHGEAFILLQQASDAIEETKFDEEVDEIVTDVFDASNVQFENIKNIQDSQNKETPTTSTADDMNTER